MKLEQEIELPCRLGEYDLISRLNRGGMGEVWLASKRGLGKPCVVKVLLKKYARDPEYRRRFLREAKILAGLRHGRIVPIIDFGESDGRLYLVMEYIDGVNLRDFCSALARSGETLPLEVVAYIMGEILEALRHAHERAPGGTPRAVIHRDVTPSNVLITSEGEVLLTDFGIARYEEEFSEELFGKAPYMAPEQALGQASVQTDLYSASGILNFMLTGKAPRNARNLMELYATADEPPPPTGRHDIPESMESLRVLGLEPKPPLRIKTAREGLELLSLWSGYRKQTTETADLYEKHVGPRHTGGTGALPAAEYQPPAPPRANPSTATTVALRPPSDRDSGDEHEERGGFVGRWWADDEPEQGHLDHVVTMKYIEPDAPRLFRRKRPAAQPKPKPAATTPKLGPPPFLSRPAASEPTLRRSPPESPRPAAVAPTERRAPSPRSPAPDSRPTPSEDLPKRLVSSSEPRPGATHRVSPRTTKTSGRSWVGPASPLIVVVALVFTAIGVALASLGGEEAESSQRPIVAEERNHPVAVASPVPKVDPEPEQVEQAEQVEPEPEPEPEPEQAATKSMRVSVFISVQRVERGQIRIGQGTVISFEPVAKVKLRPGSYPLSWRKYGADSWRDVGRLKVQVRDLNTEKLVVLVSAAGEIHVKALRKSRSSGR